MQNGIETIQNLHIAETDRVMASCMIAREKIEIGDYDGGAAVLSPWWKYGEWPAQAKLSMEAGAELMLISGVLSDSIARSRKMSSGQKQAEALISGAFALFERERNHKKGIEARIELGCCYYHQGFFDVASSTLKECLEKLSSQECDLRAVALIRLAIVERHSGRLHEAVSLLDDVAQFEKVLNPSTKGRFHTEMANTLKEMAIAQGREHYFDLALNHYKEAYTQFDLIGNLRYSAAVENNRGYLLLSLGRFDSAKPHLERAQNLFRGVGDQVRRAQVDETLAQLYLSSENYHEAERAIKLAVETLEGSGEEALLAEALTTQGLILCRLNHRHEAKPIIERARRVAERCGDREAAGRALLIMIEEMCDQLADDERREIGAQANQLLTNSQQQATRDRLRKCLDMIAEAHNQYEAKREQEIHAQKMAALGELSFGVAHNVNNTLTGILGRAQLVLRNANDPAKIQAGLELIIKSAEDGSHIIRRIQDFARKRPSREFETIAVADLLKDAFEMTRSRWESLTDSRPIRVALVADCEAFIKGDAVELREVLVNIVYNAIDAMPEGGDIRLSTHETRDQVVVSITDSGTGMTPEVKSRLFDPFFTTKGRQGTGMGLAVSFGIIRRHNGAIEVESEPGRGTTFKISLPTVLRTPSRSCDEADVPTSPRLPNNKPLVLVVDDEINVREVLIEALEAEGCEVLAAQSGESALHLYDSNKGRIDAVFTDIGMSEMSGWELVNLIRERSNAVPIAIVSGWADAMSIETRNQIKADWVVAKPFALDQIAEIAKEVSARRVSK